MALDKDRLGNAMADRVLTFTGGTPEAADETALRDLMKALAEEIITEFIDNAVVDVTTTGVTGTGTPGGPLPITAQPGTGGISS